SCSLAVLLDDLDRRREQVDVEVLLKNSPGKQQQERIKRLARELSRELPPSETTSDAPSLGVILAQAYPDWIGRRRSVVTQGLHAKTHYTLSCGAGAQIAAEEALATRKWLAVAKLGGQDREGRIFLASALNIEELEHFAPEMFSTKDRLDWDDKLERVVGERQKLIGDLVVAAHPLREINDADRARALLEGVRRRSLQCLPWTDDSRQWQARVQRIARLGLEHHGAGAFPAVDDDSLLLNLEDWLLPYLSGRSSMKALSQLDLYKVLSTMLDYQQQKLLDDLLPLRYTVPSGSQIRLRYLDEGNPVLSVKLQEMFGCTTNPSIAQGKIPLKVELLSPGGRPVQVTEDLANFWHNSYSAVKKEMAGRYPKHHWPDDPLAATPTTRAKPRKKK
ncbi:MAG: hypothetical protein KTR32_27920, partial [Granulosicoccus sp.]|nr:hypothetical protein [Granulosicoccus sp.]